MMNIYESHERACLMEEGESRIGELDILEPLPGRPESMLKASSNLMYAYIYALHIILIVLLGVIWSHNHPQIPITDIRKNSWSPVQEFLEYETHHEVPRDYTHSPYSGPPTAEIDHTWDELVKSTYFNATREELERAGEKFQMITELVGGGYLATLGVYHEIHCARQMRMYLYKDTYYPNRTTIQEEFLSRHVDHCIDVLLKAVMCHGNTAFRSYAWNNPKADAPSAQSSGTFRCVKWSSIEDWSRSRMIPVKPPIATPKWFTGEQSG